MDESDDTRPDQLKQHRFLKVREFAALIRMSPATVYRDVRRRQIPFIRRGERGRILIDAPAALATYGLAAEGAAW